MADDIFDDMDIDDNAYPEVGGAMGGCDCDMCRQMRDEYYEAQAPAAPVVDEAVPVVVKAKKAKALRKPVSNDVHLSSIKLLAPAPVTLAKAVAMLKDPAMLQQVHDAYNISHWAMVGPFHADVQMNMICHAQARSNISSPNASNIYKNSGGEMQRSRRKEKNPRYYGEMEYWNDRTKQWQDKEVQLSRPTNGKRAMFNYRYMITWSNERVKPEYHNDGKGKMAEGAGIDYTPAQVKALREYYWWLRNDSHWSRFFAGPKDRKTLFECGCILDLSAPSVVVHMLATAWRISGEMVELPEQWYALVKRGVEPHLAFGMAQNVDGFDKALDPDGKVQHFASAGHNLLGPSSIQQLARLVSGQLSIADKTTYMRPARIFYTTQSNFAYNGSKADDWDPSTNWLDAYPEKMKVVTETPNRWNPRVMDKTYAIPASAFRHQWSPGLRWVYDQVGKVMDKKGWVGYG